MPNNNAKYFNKYLYTYTLPYNLSAMQAELTELESNTKSLLSEILK